MKKNFSFWASLVLVLLWSTTLFSQEYFTKLRRELNETYSEIDFENSNLSIAPNIVTSFGSDAVLQTAGDSATAPLPYGNVYLVAIFSNATGKLCSRTTVSLGSPIGLVNLPNDVYIIKVYNYRGQECGSFSAIKK